MLSRLGDHLPLLAPLPRGFARVALGLLLSAWLLMGPSALIPGNFPGDPARPEVAVTVNLHWQVHSRGLSGYIADDLHGYPFRVDRVVHDGVPLDALTSAPLTALLGVPIGMWSWLLLVIWGLGLGGACLCGRWWGTERAAWIGGLGWQTSEVALREIGEGRATTAFALLGWPLALLAGLESARRPAGRWAVVAGLLAGLVALASWGLAPPAIFLAVLPGLLFPGRFLRLLTSSAGFGAVVAVPVAWVWSGSGELPSLSMDPWSPTLLSFTQIRPVDLATVRLYGWDGVLVRTLCRPGVWLLVVLGLRAQSLRTTRVPAALALLGLVVALGPYLPGPVVLPFGLSLELPVWSRFWWVDRWSALVTLGAVLLASGAATRPGPLGARIPAWLGARLPVGLPAWTARVPLAPVVALVFAEAFVFSRALPWPVTPLPPSDAAKVLAERPDVPFVLLPLGEGRFRPDRLDLIDQIYHGRPMANGTRPASDLRAPDALLRAWQLNAGLRGLAACETGEPPEPSPRASFDLVHAGIRQVYLDTRYVGSDVPGAYQGCVLAVLDGWTEEKEQPPFRRFQAP